MHMLSHLIYKYLIQVLHFGIALELYFFKTDINSTTNKFWLYFEQCNVK